MLVTKYKNRLFFSFLFVVYSGAYVEAQTNEKAPIFHDFSMFSMEEMGIPRWGNGQREDLFRTDPTKIKDAYFFEGWYRRHYPYRYHAEPLFNLNETVLHSGELDFRDCLNNYCTKLKRKRAYKI